MKDRTKKRIFRVCQAIIGVSITGFIISGGMLAEAQEWTWPLWATWFITVGVLFGLSFTAWLVGTLLNWKGDGDEYTDLSGKAG